MQRPTSSNMTGVIHAGRSMHNAVITATKVPQKLPLKQKLLVGGVAGIFGTSCIYPIDIVKTTLQSQVPTTRGHLLFSGPVDCFWRLMHKEGITGIYRGLGPNLIGVVPEKAIKLAANEMFRDKLEDDNGTISVAKQMLAGGGSGLVQVIATNPVEIVKIRLQMQHQLPVSQRQSVFTVLRSIGVAGLYKGSHATLLRDIPYAMIFFPMYALLKNMMGDQSMTGILLAGGISGAFSAAVVTPVDVIKTRLQLSGAKSMSFTECAKCTVRTEGYGALLKGIGPRMMVQAPLFGITLLAFEMQKKYMGYV